MTKPSTNKRKSKAASGAKSRPWLGKNPLRWVYCAAALVAVGVVCGIASWMYVSAGYDGSDEAWVFIPANASGQAVRDSLTKSLGDSYGERVYRIWDLCGGKPGRARGAYKVSTGDRAYTIARNLKNGLQSPLKITFNNARTLDDLAAKLSKRMDWDAGALKAAIDSVLPTKGYKPEEFPAAFIPDTYQAYWTQSPAEVVSTLLYFRDKFWNPDRKAKAKELGLSEVEVATIASIVEEETAKRDERPMVARLYLNRVRQGMKLQADPTVKFAVGDFSLRRILNKHLQTESPYNTYIHAGLPPGPIRVAEGATIDAVLNAPMHDYLYMCAKEDFSGYHNFAKDFATHDANAKRYRNALNERGIK